MTIRIVHRFDAGGIVRTRKTAEGFLITEGCIAQPGVMLYEQADGSTIRELVDADVLDDPVANASLMSKALTLEHPDDDVVPDNWRDLAHGTVGDWTYDDALWVALNVNSRDALDAIASGKIQLSPGYAVRVDDTPGVHPVFGAYDTRQLPGRAYNHVALTDEARGGPNLTIRRDSARQVRDDMTVKKPTSKPVKRIDADGETTEDTTQQADAEGAQPDGFAMLAKLMNDGFAMLAEAIKGKGEPAAVEVEDKGDAEGDAPADDMPAVKQDSFASLYQARRDIEAVADRHGVDLSALTKASNPALKAHVVKALRPDFKRLDSAVAVDVAFDMLTSMPAADDLYSDNAHAVAFVPTTKRDAAAPVVEDVPDMRQRVNKNLR